MTGGIFRSGNLELPFLPPAAEPVPSSWTDMGLNRALVLVSAILILASLKGFLRVAPRVFQSLGRSRACLNLEHSYNMASLRNVSALVLVLPFCLIVDRYSILPFLFGWSLPEWAGSLSVLCVLAAYVILRGIVSRFIVPGNMDYDCSEALKKTPYTFFIVLCLTMMVSLAVSFVVNFQPDVFRRVILTEIAVFYLFSLLRSFQFLSCSCNGLATFLYLCALEFIPGATVVAACMFLSL